MEGRRSVEVGHEALIRHWEKLRAWIDENRDKLRTREFLKANRAEWLKHGRDPGLLDLPRLYVEAARSLYQQPGDVVIKDVKDYVETLLDHEGRRQEAEEEKYLADISAAQSRTWVAAAAAVLLLVLAVFAGREALIANEQSDCRQADNGSAGRDLEDQPFIESRPTAHASSRPRMTRPRGFWDAATGKALADPTRWPGGVS